MGQGANRFDMSSSEGLTAGLAKGVRVLNEASDLSEEGMGFGVPAIVSNNRTYLSYSSRSLIDPVDPSRVTKTYYFDAVLQVGEDGEKGPAAYLWLETKGRVYKALPFAQRWLLAGRATGNLTKGVKFVKTRSIGSVEITYTLARDKVDMKADLTGLAGLPGNAKIYLLNEQGGRAFPCGWRDTRYNSPRPIKAGWEPVRSDKAGFSSADGQRWFALSRMLHAPMYMGREVVDGKLSWSGIEYDVSGLTDTSFTYAVETGLKPSDCLGVT
jgi:hypothetical protein